MLLNFTFLNREKTRSFFLNKTRKEDIYGFEQLPKKVEHLIICAGKKDCLILNANGFAALTFRSENHTITPEQIKKLKAKTKKLFICYDNDAAGKEASKRWSQAYDLIELSLPKFVGDVADYFLSYTKEDFKKILLESS
jgi:DNA primase